jgi:Tol biopolymer transport system component
VFWANTSTLNTIDLVARVTNHISGFSAGSKAVFSFSADGRAFAYTAILTGTNQVYSYDFQTATNTLISHDLNSAPAFGDSYSPVMSANGRLVAYRSAAINLVPGKSDGTPAIYLFDRQTGSNLLVTVSQSPLNRSFSPVFSPDGTRLFFGSWASDLEANDFNHSSDLFSFALLQLLVSPDPNPSQGLWISWAWESNRTYSVQYRAALGDAVWQDLGLTITNDGFKAYLHDSSSGTNQRFYRVVTH